MSGLILAGVAVPLVAAMDLTQTYEPLGGVTTLRMLDGTAVRREHWRKLKTTISGSGWVPAGLVTIDYSEPLALHCIAPRLLRSAGLDQALPAARRSDAGYAPYAFALLAGGDVVSTACSLVGDVATATAVAGAVAYLFHYFPVLTVYADPPAERFESATGTWNWDLVAEEV